MKTIKTPPFYISLVLYQPKRTVPTPEEVEAYRVATCDYFQNHLSKIAGFHSVSLESGKVGKEMPEERFHVTVDLALTALFEDSSPRIPQPHQLFNNLLKSDWKTYMTDYLVAKLPDTPFVDVEEVAIRAYEGTTPYEEGSSGLMLPDDD